MIALAFFVNIQKFSLNALILEFLLLYKKYDFKFETILKNFIYC